MIDKETRIKIAIQKSGRLTDHSLDLLQRCGDDDIPALVRDDVCDLGFVGLNIVEETRLGSGEDNDSETEHFSVLRRMDYGHCRLSFGYPEDGPVQSASQLNGRRIATSYPNIVNDYLKRESVDAEVVEFSGAVEIAPSLGRADVICDRRRFPATCVSSFGATKCGWSGRGSSSSPARACRGVGSTTTAMAPQDPRGRNAPGERSGDPANPGGFARWQTAVDRSADAAHRWRDAGARK